MDGMPPIPPPVMSAPSPIQLSRPASTMMSAGPSTLSVHSLDSLKSKSTGSPEQRKAAIHGAAKQVEVMFVQQALKQIRQTNEVFRSDLFKSHAGDMYGQMLDGEMAQTLSQKGFGLSAQMEKSMLLQSGLQSKALPIPSKNPYSFGGSRLPVPASLDLPQAKLQMSLGSDASQRKSTSLLSGLPLRDIPPQMLVKMEQNLETGTKQKSAMTASNELDALVNALDVKIANEHNIQKRASHSAFISVASQKVDVQEADPLALKGKEKADVQFYEPLNKVIERYTLGY